MHYSKEKEESRNQHLIMMARMFSHNLRSPIAGLKMLFPLYKMEKEESGKEDIFQNIEMGANEMFEMIEDLAKILMDYWELENPKEEVFFQGSMDSALQKLEEQIPKNSQIVGFFDSCPKAHYSQKYLDFAFLELIQNSIRFRSPDRDLKINISSHFEDGKSILVFVDNGLGLDLDLHKIDLYKMYKTFHKEKSISNRGLGIFSLKNQIEMMGGKITIDGKKDKGFSVRIELMP